MLFLVGRCSLFVAVYCLLVLAGILLLIWCLMLFVVCSCLFDGCGWLSFVGVCRCSFAVGVRCSMLLFVVACC